MLLGLGQCQLQIGNPPGQRCHERLQLFDLAIFLSNESIFPVHGRTVPNLLK